MGFLGKFGSKQIKNKVTQKLATPKKWPRQFHRGIPVSFNRRFSRYLQ